MRQWRLIYDTPTVGSKNMAIDEAILETVSKGEQLPTLRIYEWEPMCLSLGYGQRTRDVDFERLQANGWGLVRRPTGGKAILHGDELTYSVSLPRDHDLAQGDVVESYRRISEALLAALQLLDLDPQSEKQAKGNRDLGPVCFEVPSHYEITAYGKKLIGSAQVRRKTGILQHGTLPLYGDIARICDALAYPDEATREAAKDVVRERATTLEEVEKITNPRMSWRRIPWNMVTDAIVQGFVETFNIQFHEDSLSTSEQALARQLEAEVYATDKWTNKRT